MKSLTVFTIIFFTSFLAAQNHYDNNWIFSDANGSVIVNFSSGTPVVEESVIPIQFEGASAQISDEAGVLQCYTNGCAMYNSAHELMENGEELNPGWAYDNICSMPSRGYPGSHQSTMLLPWPGHTDKYIYLHRLKHVHEVATDGQFSDNLKTLYSIIDMAANDGAGLVTAKNVVFDTIRVEPTIYFNRHANGEDWWMLSPHRNSNVYTAFLIDSSGISRRDTYELGLPDSGWTRGGDQGLFNPAGDQFYRYNSREGIQMFDFDRQSGALSNFRRVEMEVFDQPTGNATRGGMGVSPSGQFAYVSTGYKVFQYDLWADDIRASRILVGLVENYQNLPAIFLPSAISFQLGPDCRLYSFTNVGDEHHVVHYPDEPGLACGWEQGWLKLPFPVFRDQIYYPNFRLGPVGKEGSPCANPITTATVDRGPQATGWPVRLYPNPAVTEVTIELPEVAPDVVAEWELYDASGRAIRREVLRGRAAVTVPRNGLSAGIYLWRLTNGGRGVATGRLVFR